MANAHHFPFQNAVQTGCANDLTFADKWILSVCFFLNICNAANWHFIEILRVLRRKNGLLDSNKSVI